MTFPPTAYTARGGVQTVSRAATVEGLFDHPADSEAEAEPQSDAGSADAPEPVAEAA
jgi:hypothetical protein